MLKGLFHFCQKENWDEVQNRLKNIGYFNEFYFLDFDSIEQSNDTKIETINPLIWKGKKYSLKKLYIQDEKYMIHNHHIIENSKLFHLMVLKNN